MVSITSSSQVYSAFAAQRQALFQKADVDSSGGLNIEEFQSLGAANGGKKPDGAPSIEDIFSQADADGNGELTTSELDTFAETNFKNRLQQGGNLSGENLLQASENFAQGLIQKADADGDGALNLDEFASAKPKDAPSEGPSSEEIFAQLDADGDGSLTESELETGFANGPPPAGGPHGSGGAHGAGGTGSASSNDDEDDETSTTYDPLDTNQDGEVSAKERLAGLISDTKNLNALVSQTLKTLLSEQEKLAA